MDARYIIRWSHGSHAQVVRSSGIQGAVFAAAGVGVLLVVLETGLKIHVIGDFDSLSAAELDELAAHGAEVLHHPVHKDKTDLELAVDLAIRKEIREILVLAALGRRWDHTLANLLLLGLPRFATAHILLLDGNQEITLLRPGTENLIRGHRGDTVSLMAVNGDARGVTTAGLEYQLQAGRLPFGATLGVSNKLTAAEATVSLESGWLICIVIHNPKWREK